MWKHYAKANSPIPASPGIGLRAPHYEDILRQSPQIGWFEVHSENYFGEGGKPHYYLEKIREIYPLSLHGVGLSLGSSDPLNEWHLQQLKRLVDRYEPGLVSEHLSWGSVTGRYLNDLLPMPYTEAAVIHLVERINRVQDYLQRQILLENVSCYLQFQVSEMTEWEFLTRIAAESGCGILLDVNNIYVNSKNHGYNAEDFISAVAPQTVQEIHLAGHTVNRFEDGEMIIDSHDKPICDAVWELYSRAVRRFPNVPVLVEWDSDLPPLAELLAEAYKAGQILECEYESVAQNAS